MADPLTMLAYVAASAYAKNKRDKKAQAVAAKKVSDEQAAAAAENVIHHWGSVKGSDVIVKRNMSNPDHSTDSGFTIQYERFGPGTKDNKPKAYKKTMEPRQETLYQTDFGILSESDLSKKTANVFGNIYKGKKQEVGVVNFDEKGKATRSYLPGIDFSTPKEKNRFLYRATDTNNNVVYGATPESLVDVKPESVSQVSLSSEQIKSVAPSIDIATLPTEKVDPVAVSTPKGEGKRLRYVVKNPNNNERMYFDSFNEAVQAGHSPKDIKTQEIEGSKDAPIVVGSLKVIPTDKDDDPVTTPAEYQDVYPLNEQGEVDGMLDTISLSKFLRNRDNYKAVGEPFRYVTKNNEKIRESIPGISSTSGIKKALRKSLNYFDMKYLDAKTGKMEEFEIPFDTNIDSPADRMDAFRNLFRSGRLPRTPEGDIAWDVAQTTKPQVNALMMKIADTLDKELSRVNAATGTPVYTSEAIADLPAYLNRKYPDLARLVPNLVEELNMRIGGQERKVHEWNKRKYAKSPTGEDQNVLTISVPAEVPAQAFTPDATPDATADATADQPPTPIRLTLPVPFAAKYNEDVALILQTTAPGSTLQMDEAGNFEFKGASETQVNQAKNVVKSLVRYEYEADGTTPRQIDGKIVVSPEQGPLDFVQYLRQSKEIDGTPYYSSWIKMVSQASSNVNPQLEAAIKQRFSEAHGGNFRDGTAMVKAFMPTNLGTNSAAFLFARLTGESVNQLGIERKAKVTQAESANQANQTFETMKSTYFYTDEQGQRRPIDINSFMGNLYVAIDGAAYFLQQNVPGVSQILSAGGFRQVDESKAFGALENQIYGKDNQGNLYYPNVLQYSDNAQIEKLAKAKNITVAEYIAKERAATDEVREKFNKPASLGGVKGINSNKEKVRNLALRNFYRYMVAYQLAAAIQGGTGGRTISDQDVLNILKALKLNAPFGKAETELEIIGAAQDMLTRIEDHARALAKGGEDAYAALKFQELTLGVTGGNMTSEDVARRLNQPGPVNTETGTAQPTEELTDTQKLELINKRQGPYKEPFGSLQEALQELGKGSFDYALRPVEN
tara:strand:+ start:2451 stop:5651 length:3201 start_codon:yes stop_codon:yes gene_type:complete